MGVISTAVKHLIAAGITGDALVRAIEEMESNQVSVDSEVIVNKRQARNKRYYERLKTSEKHLNKTIETVSDGDALPPSPVPLSSPPTPPPIIPQTPSTIPAKNRATRLSPEWQLPAAWGRWAIAEGYPEPTVRLEAQKFRDYWISKSGKDATKVDWEATWRNWMRNSRSAPVGSQAPPRPPSIADVLKQQVLEMQENERRQAEESDGDGEADGPRPPVLRLEAARR